MYKKCIYTTTTSINKKMFRLLKRSFSSKPFFVTTPIFYVNASPHIGHLYSALIADVLFRFENLSRPNGSSNLFTTGTDEHGIKIQQAAQKQKVPVNEYCDKIANEYKVLFKEYQINYSDFIRTTETRHTVAVQKFWTELFDKGFIYKRKYSGYYCVPDETFLTDSQLGENPKTGEKYSLESGHPVEWTEEENYMFQLEKVQSGIFDWLKSGNRIKPKLFEKNVYDFLEEMPDISVSRPSSRVHWGISVPGDESQTIYVWLNALVNYLTCSGYPNNFGSIWPPDVQVIGKDILKFHAIYWPGFLIAAGLEPPKQILCHSHWTVEGQKMSKSKFNVVDPMERKDIYTAEGFRYFLLREAVLHNDGNYSDTKAKRIINSELADTFGNLLSRCCAKSLNPGQNYPEFSEEEYTKIASHDITKKLIESLKELPVKCTDFYKDWSFHSVADSVIANLHLTNNFFETLKPWELKKDESRRKELDTILLLTMESLRISSILFQPMIPALTEQLLDKLNVPDRSLSSCHSFLWENNGASKFDGWKLNNSLSAVLFKRIL